MKNPPVLQSAGIGFAARDEKVTASVAAAQQQDRVRSGFRNIVAQFNLISRQRQCQFSGGDGAGNSCVAGGASVLLGWCSRVASVLGPSAPLLPQLYIRCTTVVHALSLPWASVLLKWGFRQSYGVSIEPLAGIGCTGVAALHTI